VFKLHNVFEDVRRLFRMDRDESGQGISPRMRMAAVIGVGIAAGVLVGLTGGVGAGLLAALVAAAAVNGLLRPED
jgi:hypothetical protein